MKSVSFQGTGWSFPPTFDHADYSVSMVSGPNNINQSIRQILDTRLGDRSALPTFGSKLHQFMFQTVDQTLQNELRNTIRSSLIQWEPRIDVNQVEVSVSNDAASTVSILVDYTIRSTNTRHNHVYPYSLFEGSNLEYS